MLFKECNQSVHITVSVKTVSLFLWIPQFFCAKIVRGLGDINTCRDIFNFIKKSAQLVRQGRSEEWVREFLGPK